MRSDPDATRGRLGAALLVAAALLAVGGGRPADDPIADGIRRWEAFLAADTTHDEFMDDARAAATVYLDGARRALDRGWRLLALQRYGYANTRLSAAVYVRDLPAQARADSAGFRAEWVHMRQVLRDDLVPRASALDGVRPAAVRALGEIGLPQIGIYHDASLEYGLNTMPGYGLYYLGIGQAQREFAALCRTLPMPPPRREPAYRPLTGELDSLNDVLLAAYRPPASIDRHRDFILAHATVKEARELDALGLRRGALMRYLQAAMLTAQLAPPSSDDAAALAARLHALESRLGSDLDHSIARFFVETAEAELADSAGTGHFPRAAAIVADVLPRYFAALSPAAPRPPRPAPEVTVTLVRWPYT